MTRLLVDPSEIYNEDIVRAYGMKKGKPKMEEVEWARNLRIIGWIMLLSSIPLGFIAIFVMAYGVNTPLYIVIILIGVAGVIYTIGLWFRFKEKKERKRNVGHRVQSDRRAP